MRTICWFSAGAASAVAAKLTLTQYPDAEILYCDTGSEHPDNARFLADCSKWFGREITMLKSDEYADTWDVWEKTRWLVGPSGARCTTELKKRLRFAYQKPDDIQVIGYTVEEEHRAKRLRENNFDCNFVFPLIERGLTKADCLGMIERAGIKLPEMYRLGYRNNNCIPCPKGGAGYFNKIRRDFPDAFVRMAKLERSLDVAILKRYEGEERVRVFLDELDPDMGNHKDEPDIDCSLLCAMAETEYK